MLMAVLRDRDVPAQFGFLEQAKGTLKSAERHSDLVRCRQAGYQDTDRKVTGSVKYHEMVTTRNCHT